MVKAQTPGHFLHTALPRHFPEVPHREVINFFHPTSCLKACPRVAFCVAGAFFPSSILDSGDRLSKSKSILQEPSAPKRRQVKDLGLTLEPWETGLRTDTWTGRLPIFVFLVMGLENDNSAV